MEWPLLPEPRWCAHTWMKTMLLLQGRSQCWTVAPHAVNIFRIFSQLLESYPDRATATMLMCSIFFIIYSYIIYLVICILYLLYNNIILQYLRLSAEYWTLFRAGHLCSLRGSGLSGWSRTEQLQTMRPTSCWWGALEWTSCTILCLNGMDLSSVQNLC